MQAILKVNHLNKSFSATPVLNNVSFELHRSEVLGLIGPSGSGKTTLLKCLSLLENFNSGTIELTTEDNIQVDSKTFIDSTSSFNYHKNIGFVFQDFNLWNWMTVLENLTIAPILVKKQNKSQSITRAKELCDSLGLTEKLHTKVWKLSGGQKQRVAILRALMMDPAILFLDEITSGLDPHLTVSIMDIIKRLQQTGMTMIVVTHHIEFATTICDRIMFLSSGKIGQIDTPHVLRNNPATEEIEKFINLLISAR